MGKVSMITDGLENIGPLRTGGQGSVYKCRRIGEIYSAVKLLPTPICAENSDDKNFITFQNEVLKLKKVNEEPNPHIVKILNSGLTDSGSFPFIEMEYIEGPDLEELIKSPNDAVFTIKEIIKVADQLANALAHCHRAGVKHGDIKSNNVKYNIHSGNYILLDFGLAVMSDEQRRTSLRYAGAIEFMAPEQSDGILRFESDVYSFGIILYELFAGRVPFPLLGSSETARNNVMISHLESPVPDVRQLRRENLPETWSDEEKQQEMLIPGWLLNVIAKCLQKKPEDRYKSGIELYEDIVMNRTLAGLDCAENFNNAGLLQHENEKLHTLLMKHKQTLKDRDLQLSSVRQMLASIDTDINNVRNECAPGMYHNKVHIPKAAFAAILIILLSLSAFTGYSILSNKDVKRFSNVPPKDSSQITDRQDLIYNKKGSDSAKAVLINNPENADNGKAEDLNEDEIVKKPVIVSESNTSPDDNKVKTRRELRKEQKQHEKEKRKKGKFIEVKFIK